MRAVSLFALLLVAAGCDDHRAAAATRAPAQPPIAEPSLEDQYRVSVERIIAASAEAEFSWEWLRTLCVEVGHRLSGSESLESAVAWAAAELRAIPGVEVTLQEVEVPVWVRGEESLTLLAAEEGQEEESLLMVGLGGSVGTPEEGIEGEVIVLGSLDEIEQRADELEGRVVLFDRAMPRYAPEQFETGYGETVPIRTSGPARAAEHGALAVLIRSVTDDAGSPPHTGATRYEDDGPRIPGAAVTVPIAERLHRMVDAGQRPRVRLRMEARDEPRGTSHNVIAELRGAELPDEIVVFGGHIDSWDVGQGCHDDGAGVVSAMAALRLLRELDLAPRRTLRAVLFTNEENGLGGARAYDEEHWGDGLHVAGIESDIGAARVIGLQVQTEELRQATAVEQLGAITHLLAPTGVRHARAGYGGADLSPLRARGMPAVGVLHDPAHYFDLHHSASDTFEAVDHDDFLQGVAVMAATAYVLADMEPRLSNPR